MSLRVVFMGTPVFAATTLLEIVGHGHEVVAAYTRAPAASGRGMTLKPSPVHALADKLGIPVHTPKSLRNDEASETFKDLAADVAVVVAYGMILPKAILDAPALGCLNLHASLLPRWRGAAPIQRAIMAGDTETGVAVMRMEEGLDTGPVAMMERVPIPRGMDAGALHDRLMILGADLMVRALAALSRGGLTFTPQAEEGVTYAHKIGNEDARIDWALSARQVADHIRGLSPFPGAFFHADFGRGSERVKVLSAEAVEGPRGAPGTILDLEGLVACGEGSVKLGQVQRAGRSLTSSPEFLRGARRSVGEKLE